MIGTGAGAHGSGAGVTGTGAGAGHTFGAGTTACCLHVQGFTTGGSGIGAGLAPHPHLLTKKACYKKNKKTAITDLFMC